MPTIITAGDASNGLAFTAGNDGAVTIQSGLAGAKVSALSIASDGEMAIATAIKTGTSNRFRMKQSMCRIRKSVGQSITNATLTVVTWDVEGFDTDNLHDNSTNNSRMTAQVTGKYIVGATLVYSENTTGARGVHVRKNGTTYYGGNEPQTPAAGGIFHDAFSHTTLVDLLAGDYVEIISFQASGVTLTITGGGNNPDTMAWMTLIGE
jgi:hypothetical protein